MYSTIDSTSVKSPIESKNDADDWWGTLFKPKFTFDECREILDFKIDANSESSLSLPSDDIHSIRGFREISDDIRGDINVYRRVWRIERFNCAVTKCMSENNLLNIEDCDKGYLCCDSVTQTDSCIWDTKELKIIRSCIKDFKRKNNKLEAIVKHLTSKNEELTTKNLYITKRLERKTNTLNEAIKANERFNILMETLSSQLDEIKERNKYLIEQKDEMLDEQIIFENKIENLKKEILEKDNEIRKQKKKLEKNESQFNKMLEKAVNTVELKYKGEIVLMEMKLDEMTKTIRRESYLHRATETGFQHLLKHFSGPKSEETVNIKSIKYVNL